MKKQERSQYTMRLDSDLMKRIKILAIEEGKKTSRSWQSRKGKRPIMSLKKHSKIC